MGEVVRGGTRETCGHLVRVAALWGLLGLFFLIFSLDLRF
jgi:hypothetical protein